MTDPTTQSNGRTRWRRFGLAFVPAMGAVMVTMGLMATGVLAIPIAISGTQFTVAATNLSGSGFTQYGAIDFKDASAHTGMTAVAVNLINKATLSNLVQTVCAPTPLTPLTHQDLKVEIKANPAVATGLVVDATSLTGDATFGNIKIGVPAPSSIPDAASIGSFAQTADSVNINGLTQKAVYTEAGTFSLTGLSLIPSFVPTGTC